jgi:carbon storage regulator
MLILSRKVNESIIIEGRIIVKVLRIERDSVKLGVQAPADMPVHREEVYEAIQRSQAEGRTGGTINGFKETGFPGRRVKPENAGPPAASE